MQTEETVFELTEKEQEDQRVIRLAEIFVKMYNKNKLDEEDLKFIEDYKRR